MRRGGYTAFLLSLLAALLLQLVVLPAAVEPLRPLWLPLVLGYWAMWVPEMPVLILAWATGLCCDVVYDSPLGQYALGLVTVAFLLRRLRGTLVVFPLWQATLALAPAWAIYAFLMFWIDGLTHHSADPLRRWLPVLSTTLLWPLVVGVLDSLLRPRRRSVLP
jgi:rod shape-determining protein MreD